MLTLLKNLVREESGQDLAEYAIALAVITLAAIFAVKLVGTSVANLWNNASSTLNQAT